MRLVYLLNMLSSLNKDIIIIIIIIIIIKTCPSSRYQAYRPGTPYLPSGLKALVQIWSYRADWPGNATVDM